MLLLGQHLTDKHSQGNVYPTTYIHILSIVYACCCLYMSFVNLFCIFQCQQFCTALFLKFSAHPFYTYIPLSRDLHCLKSISVLYPYARFLVYLYECQYFTFIKDNNTKSLSVIFRVYSIINSCFSQHCLDNINNTFFLQL